jgi:hypothetical protein
MFSFPENPFLFLIISAFPRTIIDVLGWFCSRMLRTAVARSTPSSRKRMKSMLNQMCAIKTERTLLPGWWCHRVTLRANVRSTGTNLLRLAASSWKSFQTHSERYCFCRNRLTDHRSEEGPANLENFRERFDRSGYRSFPVLNVTCKPFSVIFISIWCFILLQRQKFSRSVAIRMDGDARAERAAGSRYSSLTRLWEEEQLFC